MKILIGIFLFFLLATSNSAFAQQKVRLNWGAISGVVSPIWVAQEEGLFKKHGLDVELIHIASTSKAIQSMVAGEIQFTTADALNSIQAVAAGADVVMICEGVNRFVFSLMARPELKRLSDLRGKKIGITRIGSSTHTAVLFALKQGRFGSKRLHFVQLGGGPYQLQHFLARGSEPAGFSDPAH